jgi:branched-chain amino acid transport system substrate-binding protein
MIHTFAILLLVLSSVIRAENEHGIPLDTLETPKGVLDRPVEFSGEKGINQNKAILKEVRIGLFLPTGTKNKYDQSLINAANLAVEEINASGGYKSIPFRLITRWSSDPWGAGSKEMIKLVYQDSVLAVIGSIDGEATHVAEQIVTKAWLPLLSPISADPTLTYIRIPWIFRLPPDFKAQSTVLVNAGMKVVDMNNIGLITEINHDGRIFANDVKKVMSEHEIFPKFHFEISTSGVQLNSLIHRILSFNPNSIIICLSRDNIIKLLDELGDYTNHINIFSPWIPGLDGSVLSGYYHGNINYIEPFLRSSNQAFKEFEEKFQKSYNSTPLFGAAYTYDAVNILYNALQKSGLNRIKLREAISTLRNFQGATGRILWDNGGSNIVQPINRSLSGGLNE